MHKIFPCVFPLLKCTSSATRGRIQTCVYACESPQSVNMHVHRASVFVCSPVCMCMCVLLQGLCVRGVEHLNINNCHVGHLGPRSQLAPWAQSHHQHSCHRVQKREERGGGIWGRKWETRNTHSWLCVYIWEWIWETEMQTDINREKDPRVTSALHDHSLRCLSSPSLFIYLCLSCQPWV